MLAWSRWCPSGTSRMSLLENKANKEGNRAKIERDQKRKKNYILSTFLEG
jgi:hypothetical protein